MVPTQRNAGGDVPRGNQPESADGSPPVTPAQMPAAEATAAGRNGTDVPIRADQTLADLDQTLADLDQTGADGDQTSADRDQSGADRDQSAADRDQAASDRDHLAAGVDQPGYELSRSVRRRTTELRERTARDRLEAANLRDEIARSRDLVALARDRAAAARDLAMAQQDAAEQRAGSRADFGVEILLRAAEQRRRAAEYRILAAEHRELAAEDRRAADVDRQRAAAERMQAMADREALSRDLAAAETDPLTEARSRTAGLEDLDERLERCHRAETTLTLGYVDMVGLRQVNDSIGHAAGDELLRQLAQLIRARLRREDLIVRIGGDEFFCALAGMSAAEAEARLEGVAADMATVPNSRGIRTGLATSRRGDSPLELIARAEADLISRGSALGALPQPGLTPGKRGPG